MQPTFEQEITFMSKDMDPDTKQWIETPVTKTATFKELSRTDKTQHKLHFMLMSIIESDEESGDKLHIDSDKLYDITTKFIKTLLVINENFTEQNKGEFLSDSGALLSFGLKILGDKITPFFVKLMTK
jgi:hypothetical protein